MRKKSLRAMKSAVFQAPESRAEAIMQNILGANNVLVPPEAPFEEILQAILYNTPYTKEAEARIEDILLAIKNNGTYDGEPQSRDEEILLSKLNQTPYTKDAESRIEELFILWAAQSIVKQLEGVPPLTFTAIGNPLISWSIYGNLTQTGTPSSSSPIYPSECGERTENLFDEVYTSIDTSIRYKPIYVGNGTFTLSSTAPLANGSAAMIFFLAGERSGGADTSTNGVYNEQSRSVTATNGYVTIAYRTAYNISPVDYDTMLNSGSTAKPYEPFGFKLPIICGNATTPYYLSEPIRKIGTYTDVASDTGIIRNIYDWILNGQENWNINDVSGSRFFYVAIPTAQKAMASSERICSHFATTDTYINPTGAALRIYDNSSQFANVTAFKAFLTQEYTNSTPVTVWYILATAETESVTAPTIPTVNGSNTFDVYTTLKPSNVYIEYQ